MFKGEGQCCKCSRKVYWKVGEKYYCGFHADKTKRVALKPNPEIVKQRKEKLARYLKVAQSFCDVGTVGKIIVRRAKMFGETPLQKGYFTVLPNYRAGKGTELILAASELSPMSLGPVKHKQEGLPNALNLENFHQFNKVFPGEVDDDGNILPIWFERQLKGYEDAVPHRHKLGSTKAEHLKAIGKGKNDNPNHCLFSLFKNPVTGVLKKYSYVKSRVFYCTFYEKLAKKQDKYKKLLEMYKNGANLLIAGYDACDIDEDATLNDIYKMYNDDKTPFGHEKVLFTMLKLHETPENCPWRTVKLEFEL